MITEWSPNDQPHGMYPLENDYAGAGQPLHIDTFTQPQHGTVTAVYNVGMTQIVDLVFTRDPDYLDTQEVFT